MTTRHLVPRLCLGLVALGVGSCAADNGGAPVDPEKGGESSAANNHSGNGGDDNSAGSGNKAGATSQASKGGGGGDKATGGSGGSHDGAGGAGDGGKAMGTGGSLTGNKGGSSGTGGNGGKGKGGSSGMGGGGSGSGTGKGGSSGTAGGTGGGEGTGDCKFTVKTKSMATDIPTVGIVEWSSDPAPTEATIEFGLDTKYGLTAPVDLKEANYRTLILGMKGGSKTYHFRINAKVGDKTCTSADDTLPATGKVPSYLPALNFQPDTATGLDGGFLILETFQQTFGAASGDSPAYIIDGDGDYVWWYQVKGTPDLTRAKQSYDGKYMWIARGNVGMGDDGGSNNKAKVVRVSMDGKEVKDFTTPMAHLNHDFAVRSDETVAFIAYGANSGMAGGCDDIKEMSPSGTVTTIVNSGDAVGASACHCNAIQYDRKDDSIIFSELDSSAIVKVNRTTKKVVWVFSSHSTKKTVSGVEWTNEHNFHIIDDQHLLFFNNNTGPNATAIEAQFALATGGTATKLWTYASNVTNQVMGDVQRLENGNTLVTYSTAGQIREVNSSGTVLQTISGQGQTNVFGYAEKRKSLYGAPPR